MRMIEIIESLQAMSDTFLVDLLLKSKKTIIKIRKNDFYFTSKVLVVLEIFSFYTFRIFNVMVS